MLAILLGADHLLLGMRDGREYLAGRKSLFIQAQILQAILDDPLTVIGIVDGKIAAVADAVNIAAQNTHAGRMEGGRPHIAAALPQHPLQALLQLIGSLVGKGDGQHLIGLGRLNGAEILGQWTVLLRGRFCVALQKLHLILGNGHGDLVTIAAATVAQEVGNTVDQHRRLAASRACQQQQRPFGGQYTLPLHGI